MLYRFVALPVWSRVKGIREVEITDRTIPGIVWTVAQFAVETACPHGDFFVGRNGPARVLRVRAREELPALSKQLPLLRPASLSQSEHELCLVWYFTMRSLGWLVKNTSRSRSTAGPSVTDWPAARTSTFTPAATSPPATVCATPPTAITRKHKSVKDSTTACNQAGVAAQAFRGWRG